MSGIGFWEFIFLCMIGLVVLGPKRLPVVANQLGSWVGQARRMTRTLKRQLEEELDLDKELNVRPSIAPVSHPPPLDDDSFSPLHDTPAAATRIDLGASDESVSGDRAADDAADDDAVPTDHSSKETDREQ